MDSGAPPRLTSAMLVSVLVRRVQAAGGFAAILRHGDDQAGAIMVECTDRGVRNLLIELGSDIDGRERWLTVGNAESDDAEAHAARLRRRVQMDPDLWIVELDIADAERFAAETIASA